MDEGTRSGTLRPACFTRLVMASLIASAAIGAGYGGSEDTGTPSDEAQAASPNPKVATAGQRGWWELRHAKLKRTEVTAARIGRFIYVVGGFEKKTGGATATVERYDIRRNRWWRVAALPVALHHAAAVAHRDRLYVVGGYGGKTALNEPRNSLYRYTPRRNTWRGLASMPTRRGALAAAALGDRLFAIGGEAGGRSLRRVEIFNFKTRRWHRGPSLREGRNHIAAVATRGAVFVFAGRAASGNLKSAERYRPSQRRWQKLPDVPTARSGIAAAVVGREIVVFGGEEGSGTIAEVEALNSKNLTWRSLPKMRTPRHGLGGTSRGQRVYAIEGGPEPGFAYSDKNEVLDLAE